MTFVSKFKLKSVECLVKSGLLNLFKILTGRKHIILNFHKIRPKGFPPDPFDTCPSISIVLFREILLYLRKCYEIVSISEFSEKVNQGHYIAAITFDDGWKDTYEIAFPLLQELKIPATIFITTGKIGKSEPFWQQKLGRLFSFAVNEGGKEEQENLRRMLGVDKGTALDSDLYRQIVKKWKSSRDSEINGRLNTNQWLKWTTHYKNPLFMTSDNIKEMASKNIDFGSHTVNHVILTKESDAIVESELIESKKMLEDIIRKSVDMLAYPGGAFSNEIIRKAVKCGYKVGFTTQNYLVRKKYDPMKCPRVDLDWNILEDKFGSLNKYLFQWGIR